jgi:hypothetical protein
MMITGFKSFFFMADLISVPINDFDMKFLLILSKHTLPSSLISVTDRD